MDEYDFGGWWWLNDTWGRMWHKFPDICLVVEKTYQETGLTGDRTQACCVRGNNITPRSQFNWNYEKFLQENVGWRNWRFDVACHLLSYFIVTSSIWTNTFSHICSDRGTNSSRCIARCFLYKRGLSSAIVANFRAISLYYPVNDKGEKTIKISVRRLNCNCLEETTIYN